MRNSWAPETTSRFKNSGATERIDEINAPSPFDCRFRRSVEQELDLRRSVER